MADATVSVQPAPDTITAIDILTIVINLPVTIASLPGVPTPSPAGSVFYRLRLTWASGATSIREGTVSPADFNANTAAFLQAGAKKKFLQSLVALGYEPTLVPQ